jgi:hypothetical protein
VSFTEEIMADTIAERSDKDTDLKRRRPATLQQPFRSTLRRRLHEAEPLKPAADK